MKESAEPGPLRRKLHRFVHTTVEHELLAQFSTQRRHIEAGKRLVNGDQAPRSAYVLHEGWACSFREMSDGRRQIFDFRLPGDFVGLQSLLLKKPNYDVIALTEVVVSEVGIDRLISTIRQSPQLCEGVLWSLSRDTVIILEHLVNIGSRGALERTVHLLIEIGYRLNQVGYSEKNHYECPLTQKDLAEAVGITHVHLNRVLRHLRRQKLLSFTDHAITLDDLPALIRIAEFESFYLDSSYGSAKVDHSNLKLST